MEVCYKAYIGNFSAEQLAKVLTASCFVAVKLPDNDPYGKTLPDTMKKTDFQRAEDGTATIKKPPTALETPKAAKKNNLFKV